MMESLIINSVNDVINVAGIQKTDSNMRKLLGEEGWRKADGEEKEAFLGYCLLGRNVKKSIAVIRMIVVVCLLVSMGELGFELLLKGDPSYDPVPMIVAIVICTLLLLLNEVAYRMYRSTVKARIENGIYVIDAIAMETGSDRITLTINGHAYGTEQYVFDEAAGPMDYVYDEKGHNVGFRVLLYIVAYGGECERKVVLGSHGYRYYLDKYKKAYR